MTDTDKDLSVKTTLISRNITVKGRRTSVRLELEMWRALKEIADRESCTIHDIYTLIKMRKNPMTSLTAAIRVFLMLYFRASSNEEGHIKAGHGDFGRMMRRARVQEEDGRYFSVMRGQEHYVLAQNSIMQSRPTQNNVRQAAY
jgi:predicted DNA-binding ribbon-helix-helix protein